MALLRRCAVSAVRSSFCSLYVGAPFLARALARAARPVHMPQAAACGRSALTVRALLVRSPPAPFACRVALVLTRVLSRLSGACGLRALLPDCRWWCLSARRCDAARRIAVVRSATLGSRLISRPCSPTMCVAAAARSSGVVLSALPRGVVRAGKNVYF